MSTEPPFPPDPRKDPNRSSPLAPLSPEAKRKRKRGPAGEFGHLVPLPGQEEQLPEWSLRNPVELQRALERARKLRARIARDNINEFVEFVMRNEETNRPLRQMPVHEKYQSLFTQHDQLMLWSHPESGKALPLDTPIPTPDRGFVPLGEIEPGDTVFDRFGKPTAVTFATEVMHDHLVYEITLDDGAVIRADAEHRWIVRDAARYRKGRRSNELLTRLTADFVSSPLRLSDGRYRWSLPVAGAVDYAPKRIPLPLPPYVLGAWLGDGTSRTSEITFCEAGRPVWNRCVALVGGHEPKQERQTGIFKGTLGPKVPHKTRLEDCVRKRLRGLKVLENKHIPNEYLTAPKEDRLELLAGLLDTDGTISDNGKNRVEFCVCNERLAKDTLELVRSLGMKATCVESDAVLGGRVVGRRYRVSFTAKEQLFRLPAKMRRFCPGRPVTDRTEFRQVVAVRALPSVPVRCISVDSEDRSFIAGREYVTTHNTVQSVARVLWELGRDPSLRVVVISGLQEQADKFLTLVKRYIEQSTELRLVFPHLRPGETWKGNAITVDRPSNAKDFSIQTVTAGSSGIQGSRIDLLILDDILNFDNTLTPGRRAYMDLWYKNTINTRLTGRSRVWVLGNAFHPDDLYHRLSILPGWEWEKVPVLAPNGASNWPDQWPLERIQRKREALGPLVFAQQYLCQARDDAAARFKRDWIERCLERGEGRQLVKAMHVLPPGYRAYTGVDLGLRTREGSDLTVFFTIVVHPNGDREVICIESGRWSGPEIVQRIIDTHDRFGSIIYVESVAAQKFIVDFAAALSSVPVMPFNTGKNKADPLFGFESLAVEMSNAKWIIPNKDGKVHREVEAWLRELLYYDPDAHTGDRAMASWIAREGSRTKQQRKGRTFAMDTMSR